MRLPLHAPDLRPVGPYAPAAGSNSPRAGSCGLGPAPASRPLRPRLRRPRAARAREQPPRPQGGPRRLGQTDEPLPSHELNPAVNQKLTYESYSRRRHLASVAAAARATRSGSLRGLARYRCWRRPPREDGTIAIKGPFNREVEGERSALPEQDRPDGRGGPDRRGGARAGGAGARRGPRPLRLSNQSPLLRFSASFAALRCCLPVAPESGTEVGLAPSRSEGVASARTVERGDKVAVFRPNAS